ncbi:tripeptidyl peptidase A [Coniophora puteana RWD-64-598 SS2]|uniref:tripeptidyl-peptidase II n=1 Tax=Coniophora puteana (strain RWD-64-598) TaxID=741705 RepID=A0A5M3M9K7_CONPW|nr:tripeptidyl peptidase A [Coniophora puteana RWD-64-598 SS2]EIW75859.1 tripeptidyl peptidase A [Coniophora puteana RWD-64-598 SS2]
MKLSIFVALALSPLFANAFRGSQPVIKESIRSAPLGWTPTGRAPADYVLSLKLALAQSKFADLESHLREASDPAHPNYGAHLSKEEVHAFLTPEADTLDIVHEWLSSHGVGAESMSKSAAGDWVTLQVPVELAEQMFDTQFHAYVHEASGDTAVRTTSYSLPSILHPHIDLVQPTTMYARTQPARITYRYSGGLVYSAEGDNGTITGPAGNALDQSCSYQITPTCLKQLYNAEGYIPSNTSGNAIGITGYIEQYANYEDLQTFYKSQNPAAAGSNFTFVSVNGGKNIQDPANASTEANLDVQYALGMTYPTPGTFWSTAGEPPFIPDEFAPSNVNTPWADWADYILNQTDVPQTISTSYGDSEETVPFSYADRVCKSFAALGARGVSLLFGSGDGGVGLLYSAMNQTCHRNNGSDAPAFLPMFPSSCPYVTSVGATIGIPEAAANFSGGGFSNYWGRPSYQQSHVDSYLSELGDKYAGMYNASGRAYPDVSAQGVNYLVYIAGQPHNVSGTSAATPAFAAIVSMLNDARLRAGKSSLGFLNPILYGNASVALNDVTEGNNPGCATPGFNATKGWDPVTGLGTPNFEKLKDVVMSS